MKRVHHQNQIMMRLIGLCVFSTMILAVVFSLTLVLRNPPSDAVPISVPQHSRDKLLGGLVAAGLDETSCVSRYDTVINRKGLSAQPSSYLISKLRKYEALHRECESYNTTSSHCKYLVLISYSGLGNRMLAIASAFLYALLTNRVLLLDPGPDDITHLFCDPFPHSSWFLPPHFPLHPQFHHFNHNSPRSYGNMLKQDKPLTTSQLPSFLYLHLAHDYDHQDKLFFCDEHQLFLHQVPWLLLRTDNYFVPSLFLMPSFQQELNHLFPNRETVFHFLARYLFHPTNRVWGLVVRYYQAYLANVDQRVGLQIRVFHTGTGPFQHVLDQILACVFKENLLPHLNTKQPTITSSGKPKSKAVLVTSLSSGYFEKLRDMYWEFPTTTGEVVGVFQPSHEGYQQTEKQMHNQKAWAEMYLLSLTDVLVTSAWSTFGYVAQGMGGLKPWILYKPENKTAPDPPCQRAMSMEPCFHAPPFYDCKAKRGIDTGKIVPHVRHCEDMSWGLKLVND
ncbi:Galactoside 2-alpha-L-fucosyltransferase [Stylosanthes scabra]|uniref:Fucosyltransferase n=1 Tax=Stylosanthes scabra TaxID=79078 RepID=A0ABU6Z4F5_9FABA|nr:Galactoside 2-alpha-L-fucosyltransferase [Stylosanthes scabra]